MSPSSSRVSAREYASIAGLDYGRVRHYAAQGRIPGATKSDKGTWLLPAPNPPATVLGRDNGETRIAGYGTRPGAKDWVDLTKLTKAQYRVHMRHADLNAIKAADRVVYYRKGGFKTSDNKFVTVHGPLGERDVADIADELGDVYGIGYAA